ncbi:hypothetical protein EHQ30_01265 [Leptospira brenneri]|uniref:Major facilitator superfamily (MFS) profile domain-containing protein n=1 Tax=Leptospira brenneri TaxID=2023182 RepID=A0A5F1Z7D3_9LEPT|nr:hypothetical protein [Leptospira brenneri]TGK95301.1 hypothetical protein EHQ30_01265 [Leptospira brenneri]
MIGTLIKSILMIAGCMVIGGLIGFFGPFIIAQFDQNGAAWSMITMITVPIGFVLGLVIGLFIVFGFSFPGVVFPILACLALIAMVYFLIFNQ